MFGIEGVQHQVSATSACDLAAIHRQRILVWDSMRYSRLGQTGLSGPIMQEQCRLAPFPKEFSWMWSKEGRLRWEVSSPIDTPWI